MTAVAERPLLLDPLIASWDAATIPVAWPGDDFEPPAASGSDTAPARWIDVDISHEPGQYLTFTENEIPGELDIACYVEPVADIGDRFHRQMFDDLQTAYTGQNQAGVVYFLLGEISIGDFFKAGGWLRQDWVLPFRRFE